jgi:kynurenine 3-monooxygenase
MEVRLPADQNG